MLAATAICKRLQVMNVLAKLFRSIRYAIDISKHRKEIIFLFNLIAGRGDEFDKIAAKSFPRLYEAAENTFRKQNAAEAAVGLFCAVYTQIAPTSFNVNDINLARLQLSEYKNTGDVVTGRLSPIVDDYFRIHNMLEQWKLRGFLTEHTLLYFRSEFAGCIFGQTPEERSDWRMSIALNEALGHSEDK